MPKELLEYVAKNPQVKFIWDGKNPLIGDSCYKIIQVANGNFNISDRIKGIKYWDTINPRHCFFRIIIPNYNNKPYISRCLDSILEQSFQDFHIIVVDDLSTDGSDRICEEYMNKFPEKVTLIRADKKGHEGGCRNIGMEYANVSSDYTYFVDGDDELYGSDALKLMYEQGKDKQYDIILVGIVQKEFSTGKLTFNKERIFD